MYERKKIHFCFMNLSKYNIATREACHSPRHVSKLSMTMYPNKCGNFEAEIKIVTIITALRHIVLTKRPNHAFIPFKNKCRRYGNIINVDKKNGILTKFRRKLTK